MKYNKFPKKRDFKSLSGISITYQKKEMKIFVLCINNLIYMYFIDYNVDRQIMWHYGFSRKGYFGNFINFCTQVVVIVHG